MLRLLFDIFEDLYNFEDQNAIIHEKKVLVSEYFDLSSSLEIYLSIEFVIVLGIIIVESLKINHQNNHSVLFKTRDSCSYFFSFCTRNKA